MSLRIVALLALLGSVARPAPAQQNGLFGCTTGTNHDRWALKTRHAPATNVASNTVTLRDILAWPVPVGSRTDNNPVNPREQDVFTVSGFVRKIKQSPDDCDVHLELAASPTDANAPRIVVEIPAENAALQQQVSGVFGLTAKKKNRDLTGPQAKNVTVTGYAFVDLSHQCSKNQRAGCNHGSANVRTLWEIHPVFSLTVAP